MTPQAKNISVQPKGLIPRSYPSAMLLPFFPEAAGIREYSTKLGEVDVKVYVEGEENTLAAPSDRKLLNILSAALARQIRDGVQTRHVYIQIPELLGILEGDRRSGGEDYIRLREKLERIMATVIETSEPIAGGMRRNRRFRWVDAFEYDSTDTHIGGRTKAIRISLSEEAFKMMAGSLGYDTPTDNYRSLISSPTSTWRIYEICLASVLRNGGRETAISMHELHQRIPLQSELKVFKSRALKNAFSAIADHPQMSKHIKLTLQRKRGELMEDISFSQRTPHDDIVILIEPKDISDIRPDRLLVLNEDENILEGTDM